MAYSIEYRGLKVVFVLVELEARVFLELDEIKASIVLENRREVLNIIRDELGREINKISFYQKVLVKGW